VNVFLRLADKIRIVGSFSHVGIILEVPYFGPIIVAHNDKHRGVEIVTLESFSAGRRVEVDSRVIGGSKVQAEMVRRARSLVGRPYDLLDFNCEHYASYVQTGKAASPQLQAVGILALVLVGVALLREV
jgi:lecithin:retinol acyltransferase